MSLHLTKNLYLNNTSASFQSSKITRERLTSARCRDLYLGLTVVNPMDCLGFLHGIQGRLWANLCLDIEAQWRIRCCPLAGTL